MKETIIPEELSFLPTQLAHEAASLGPDAVASLVRGLAACPVKRRFPVVVNEMLAQVWPRASSELRVAIAERIGKSLYKVAERAEQAERLPMHDPEPARASCDVSLVSCTEMPEPQPVAVSVTLRRPKKSRGSESPIFREVYHQLREVSQQEKRTQIRLSSLVSLERKLRARTSILEKAASLGADVRSELDAITKLLSAVGDFTNTHKL